MFLAKFIASRSLGRKGVEQAAPEGAPALDPCEPLIETGDAARDALDWSGAASAYAAALALNPDAHDIWVQLGHAHKESDAFDLASEAYERALAIEPAKADTHLNLGHLRKLQGRVADAVCAYKEAARCDPTLHHAWAELVALARNGTDFEIADLDSAYAVPSRDAAVDRVAIDVTEVLCGWREQGAQAGGQEFQFQLAHSLVDSPLFADRLVLCSFAADARTWREIPPALFEAAARIREDRTDPAWLSAVLRLQLALEYSPGLERIRPKWLVNLGGPGLQANYLSAVAQARAELGVQYAQLVWRGAFPGDPGAGDEGLEPPVEWVEFILARVDGLIVDSERTVRDLERIARRQGLDLEDGSYVVLPTAAGSAGDLSGHGCATVAAPGAGDLLAALDRWASERSGTPVFDVLEPSLFPAGSDTFAIELTADLSPGALLLGRPVFSRDWVAVPGAGWRLPAGATAGLVLPRPSGPASAVRVELRFREGAERVTATAMDKPLPGRLVGDVLRLEVTAIAASMPFGLLELSLSGAGGAWLIEARVIVLVQPEVLLERAAEPDRLAQSAA